MYDACSLNMHLSQQGLNLFVCLEFLIPPENFNHMELDITITVEGLQILTYAFLTLYTYGH